MNIENIVQYLKDFLTLYGLKIVGAIAILIIGMWVARLITKGVIKIFNKKDFDPTLSKFLGSIIKFILYLVVIIAALNQAEIETTSLVAIIGAAGLAIGFALQGSLGNFASGVMLIIFRPIKVGDFVEVAGVMGSVEEVGIFTTTLTTPDNKVIIVPNSGVTGGNITNFSMKDTRRVDMVFGIGYSDDIDKAKNIIKNILENDSRVLKDPATQIAVSELADSSVNFTVRPWVNSADYWGVYFDTHEAVKKKFDEMGVSIPFPQTDVHLFQNN